MSSLLCHTVSIIYLTFSTPLNGQELMISFPASPKRHSNCVLRQWPCVGIYGLGGCLRALENSEFPRNLPLLPTTRQLGVVGMVLQAKRNPSHAPLLLTVQRSRAS
ncbi:hypothetical protein EJ06DRAFT_206168 [Trichodelitschia bisporula]|uniref:Secreted protein n=1 Tax=Trichodelitschia bisporula TaxID=703511 RepID=A0A6G1I8W4_9PEZI|nr:hypothetical protein EJ06DRAFT_206168 [Trichodelitschia bisporula]